MSQPSIFIFARSGRMGQALEAVCRERQMPLSDDLEQADAVIDFSSPAGLLDIAAQAAAANKPLVSGTTGLQDEHHLALRQAGERIPVLWSANMSIGVNLLYRLAGQAAIALGENADCDIAEAHHRFKKDAPSGTALELGRRIAAARGQDFDQVARLSRQGGDCPRRAGEIGFSAVRAGDITGEHTALFALDGERLELTHRATDRQIFARGALHAAAWLISQPQGLYSFGDTLAD